MKNCCSPSRKTVEGWRIPVDSVINNPATIDESLMIELPGGRFRMGTDYEHGFPADGEGPVRYVGVSPFSIDQTPVTNAQFSSFVLDTGYVTDAERFDWSFVFWSHIPKERLDQLVEDTVAAAPWWCKVIGAKWCTPEGPGSNVTSRADHPVVHVSHNDAAAYAQWAGKQLPTEAEWEYAARGGLDQKLFPWGDELLLDGQHMCNVWQGEFPKEDTGEDGFAGVCPVYAFPPNNFGVYSVTGNVWEWVTDWFGTNHPGSETLNPVGPQQGFERIMKGGSFLCHASYCNRYRVAARSRNTPDSSSSNVGFRCVRRARH
jgi:formylglycine-generating enzyme required for sulfatase activity